MFIIGLGCTMLPTAQWNDRNTVRPTRPPVLSMKSAITPPVSPSLTEVTTAPLAPLFSATSSRWYGSGVNILPPEYDSSGGRSYWKHLASAFVTQMCHPGKSPPSHHWRGSPTMPRSTSPTHTSSVSTHCRPPTLRRMSSAPVSLSSFIQPPPRWRAPRASAGRWEPMRPP